MEAPKISIIVPIYNAERFLNKCITSILNQSYSNLEILLINDGSTDKSLEICYKYASKDSRIIVIDKTNGGVSSARNKGLDLATGNYIGFVDSDDFVSNIMFEKMVEAMIQNNADVVECGYYTCDIEYNNNKKYELEKSITDGNYQCSYMYLANENTTNFNWNKLYKKYLFDDLRYPNFKYSEDYWVNTKIFYRCNRKVTLNECLYYYVMNNQSAVRAEFDINKRFDTIKAAQDLYEYHYNRFSDLCSFIALYICSYILLFYVELNSINDNNNDDVNEELKNVFNKYYPEIKDDAIKKIRFRGTYICMIAFRINPKVYLLLKKYL